MKMDKDSYKKQAKGGGGALNIYIYRCFSRDHWPESIKQEFCLFLFQDVLIFTANNMPEQYDYPLLK